MKKLALAIAVVSMLVGCSKEAEVALHESDADQVVLSSSGSFDVGTIGALGVATITYDLTELAELTACAVSEDDATGLVIENVNGVGYYLKGIGSGVGSNTTFAIELTQDGSTLSWADNAVIFTCESTGSPCDLDVLAVDDFSCDNSVSTCGENVVGGENGSAYASCNWPWIIPTKSKK